MSRSTPNGRPRPIPTERPTRAQTTTTARGSTWTKSSTAATPCSFCWAPIMVLAMHARFRVSRARHGAQEEPGQCAGQDPGRLRGLDPRVLLHRLRRGLWHELLRRRRSLAANNGYELVKFFFLLTFAAAIPAIVSGGIAERARFGPQLLATAVIVGAGLPAVRRHGLERPLRHPGLDQGADRRGVPRLRRQRRGARRGRLAGAGRGAAARRAQPTATARTARSAPTRRRTSRSWRWAPGCSPWAGSAST